MVQNGKTGSVQKQTSGVSRLSYYKSVMKQLSLVCSKPFFFTVILFLGMTSSVWAQESFFNILSGAPIQYEVGTSSWLYPRSELPGLNDHLEMQRFTENIQGVLYQSNPHRLGVNVDADVLHLVSETDVPGSEYSLPSHLYDMSLGLGYLHMNSNGRVIGGGIKVGSSSDMPFISIDETTFSAEMLMRIQSRKTDSWLFYLNFANNRPTLNYYPIPGVAYFWVPNKQFQGLFGFPVTSLSWRPHERWSFNATLVPSPYIKFKAAFKIDERANLFTEYLWKTDSYLLSKRKDNFDRLFFSDHQVNLGADVQFMKMFEITARAGYLFERDIKVGQDVFSDIKDSQRVDGCFFGMIGFNVKVR